MDFGCSPAWFRLERFEVVDYGAQTWAIRPIFLFRHPNTRGLGKNVFLEPFEDPVWVVLLVSSVIIILLMANAILQDRTVMLGNLATRSEKNPFRVKKWFWEFFYTSEEVLKSFYESVRVYVSVILQQGERIYWKCI